MTRFTALDLIFLRQRMERGQDIPARFAELYFHEASKTTVSTSGRRPIY